MNCISRRAAFISRPFSEPRSRPSNSTEPSVGSMSRMSRRHRVDLPQPDSPRARASRRGGPRGRRRRRRAARPSGRVRARGSASRGPVARTSTSLMRPPSPAAWPGSSSQHAASWAPDENIGGGSATHLSNANGQRDANRQPTGHSPGGGTVPGIAARPLRGIHPELGHRLDERLRIRMFRLVQHVGRRSALHDFARVHDGAPPRPSPRRRRGRG